MLREQAITGTRVRLQTDRNRVGLIKSVEQNNAEPSAMVATDGGSGEAFPVQELEVLSFPSGTRVRIIGNEARTGKVTDRTPRESSGVPQMHINFDDGAQVWVRSSNLEPLIDRPDPYRDLRAGKLQGVASLRRNLAHEKLNGRLASVIYSMETSDTQFFAYQFKPVLKLLDSPNNSLLIADEVGLGKTIEAGLIWTELRARTGAKNLLVVCPPHLREKWQLELSRRFGVSAEICDAKTFLRHLEQLRQNPSHSFRLITSYQGLRPPQGWELEDANRSVPRVQLAHELNRIAQQDPVVDLLIVDEAHYMRNRETRTAQLGELLNGIAGHRVFLSATPIQTKSENLFSLLRLLDPDTFTDPTTFSSIIEANVPLVRLRDLLLTRTAGVQEMQEQLRLAAANPYLGNSKVLEGINGEISLWGEAPADAYKRSEMAYRVERVNLLGHAVTRTRKRDVVENKVMRDVKAIRFPLADAERDFYAGVTNSVLEYAARHELAAGFLYVMPQRQVSSCMAAACAHWFDKDFREDVEEPAPDFVPDREPSEGAHPLLDHLRENIGRRWRPETLEQLDSKYRLLIQTLRGYWSENPGRKVVLFSYFRPTLSYLRRRLSSDGVDSHLLTGGMVQDKQSVVEAFKNSKQVKLLLSSEVGGEGLDIQFASVLVNYDLPWNPMVVEQRIGRLDRIGQEADRILIFNFVAQDTIDERIYDRLFVRLDLFRRSLGDLEDVVGTAISALSRDLLTHRLTPEQERQRIDMAEIAIATKLQEHEHLEQEASVLAAYGDYVIRQIHASHDLQQWIKAEEIERYILDFFHNRFPASRFQGVDPAERSFDLVLDHEAVFQFDQFLQTQKLTGVTRLNTMQRNRVRFDNRSYVRGGRGEEIITQSHPLVRFATWTIRSEGTAACVPVAVRLERSAITSIHTGRFVFNVQRWRVSGLREFEKLHFSVVDWSRKTEVEDRVLAELLVQKAAAIGEDWLGVGLDIDTSELAEIVQIIDDHASEEFLAFEQQCINENADRANVQLTSIERYERRRLQTLTEVLEKHRSAGREALVEATRGQITKLQERCMLQKRGIKERSKTDAFYDQICFGIIDLV